MTSVSDSGATARRWLASRISQIGSFRFNRTLFQGVMGAESIQTKPNESGSGATVRRSVTSKAGREGIVSLSTHDWQLGLLKVHESEVFGLIGHFSKG
jgi:hypothetical protein